MNTSAWGVTRLTNGYLLWISCACLLSTPCAAQSADDFIEPSSSPQLYTHSPYVSGDCLLTFQSRSVPMKEGKDVVLNNIPRTPGLFRARVGCRMNDGSILNGYSKLLDPLSPVT